METSHVPRQFLLYFFSMGCGSCWKSAAVVRVQAALKRIGEGEAEWIEHGLKCAIFALFAWMMAFTLFRSSVPRLAEKRMLIAD